MVVDEIDDLAEFAGSYGTDLLAAIEDYDIAAFSGSAVWLAALSVVEEIDTAAITGLTAAFGSLSVIELSDVAGITEIDFLGSYSCIN